MVRTQKKNSISTRCGFQLCEIYVEMFCLYEKVICGCYCSGTKIDYTVLFKSCELGVRGNCLCR